MIKTSLPSKSKTPFFASSTSTAKLNQINMSLSLLVLMALTASSVTAATNITSDITVAVEEMQRANYFTFVMLINMAPPDLIPGDITFLMPNDKTLAKTDMADTSVVDFLLRHSIPSPLLIDHLEHFPTGSMIPTSRPGFVLKVTNNGRRQIFLNNVRVISPNICTKGDSIRCHGVDGVVQPTMVPAQPDVPTTPPNCAKSVTPPAAPAPLPAPSPPQPGGAGLTPVAPPPSAVGVRRRQKSGSSRMCNPGAVHLVTMLFVLVVWSFI